MVEITSHRVTGIDIKTKTVTRPRTTYCPPYTHVTVQIQGEEGVLLTLSLFPLDGKECVVTQEQITEE
jgi:hypothetical protein